MVEIAEIAVSAAELKLGTEPVQGDGVRLAHAGPKARYSLRARDAKALADVIGRALPGKIGDTEGAIACLGPDEWYALLPAGTEMPRGEGLAVSVVDVSSRALGLVLEGPGALAVLSSGCPLDLAKMGVGRATRTVFETVEIQVWREGEERWHVEVWRSFATWLWHAFVAAMHGAK
ncbi:sarcosine oxidase gamma subunit [Novosphingobium fuchskuhlense]|uniref:Sarcosine oxidase gamma subunit n=1 Tax=Novosphingobium fuchskuhlense TaxID=1117702 RepID=A0A124JU18_9SPHN|nr:sarcosine oxidase subunit gamma family protein [Novosphingobium fuchskuhlense]KUR70777.1 sarcosine oxidase gamma subunit [Novosphingobium fuchskuhlense]